MHELSLCQSMIDIIEQEAQKLKCQKVTRVFLEVGQLAGIEKAALLFAFDAVTMNTVAQEARLEIIDVEGLAVCDQCQVRFKIKHYYEGCETCNQFSLHIIQGQELRIQSIEVE